MTPEQITDDIQRAASVRLVEAGYFLKDQIQEMIGVQAPYHITASGEYVADEPATPGAPPRRLSGDLVESGFVRQVSDSQVQVVFSRPYAGWLEFETTHVYMRRAAEENATAIGRIIGGVASVQSSDYFRG
jgi:hypothetical protein